jgi:pimeloyl-ACP methyl ester carboxylesterase
MALVQWLSTTPPDFRVEDASVPVQGHAMHYLRAGTGPDLILLHGLLGTAAGWTDCLEILAANSTVYALDSLGIGQSERVPNLDCRLEAFAERISLFMDRMGIKTADFLATSHGGAVALMLAALYPERVRSLVLHAPANPFSKIADPLIRFYGTRLGKWFAHQIPTLPKSMQSLALGRMYGDAALVRRDTLENYIRSLAVPGTVTHVLRIIDSWAQDMKHLAKALPQIPSLPLLLLWGNRDRAVSLDSGYTLAKLLGDAEMIILPDAGHLPYEEDPVMFTRAVNRFLGRLDRSSLGLPLRPLLVERRSK